MAPAWGRPGWLGRLRLPGSRSSGGASRSAAGDCRRRSGLRAGPARAPDGSAHPPSPSGGGGSSNRVQEAQTPPARGHGGQDHPPEPRPESGSPPPHARADERTQSLPSLSRRRSFGLRPRGGGADLKIHSPHPNSAADSRGPGSGTASSVRSPCAWRKTRVKGEPAGEASSSSLVGSATSGRYPRPASSLLGWKKNV